MEKLLLYSHPGRFFRKYPKYNIMVGFEWMAFLNHAETIDGGHIPMWFLPFGESEYTIRKEYYYVIMQALWNTMSYSQIPTWDALPEWMMPGCSGCLASLNLGKVRCYHLLATVVSRPMVIFSGPTLCCLRWSRLMISTNLAADS